MVKKGRVKRDEIKDYLDFDVQDRRAFLKNVAMKGCIVITFGAGLSQLLPFKDFLLPEKKFHGDWKGVFPIYDPETGRMALDEGGVSKVITKEDVDSKATLGGVAEFTFFWPDHEHSNGNLVSAVIIKALIDGTERYVASSKPCTHEKCAVKWDDNEKLWLCACHIGKFSAEDGRVLAGPPPPDVRLQQFTVEWSDGTGSPDSEAILTLVK